MQSEITLTATATEDLIAAAAKATEEMEALYEEEKRSERCLKGLVSAACLEGVAAMCIFSAWHAWHLIR